MVLLVISLVAQVQRASMLNTTLLCVFSLLLQLHGLSQLVSQGLLSGTVHIVWLVALAGSKVSLMALRHFFFVLAEKCKYKYQRGKILISWNQNNTTTDIFIIIGKNLLLAVYSFSVIGILNLNLSCISSCQCYTVISQHIFTYCKSCQHLAYLVVLKNTWSFHQKFYCGVYLFQHHLLQEVEEVQIL